MTKKKVSDLKEGDRVLAPSLSFLQAEIAFTCLEDVRNYGDGSFAVMVEVPSGIVQMKVWDEEEGNPTVEVR